MPDAHDPIHAELAQPVSGRRWLFAGAMVGVAAVLLGLAIALTAREMRRPKPLPADSPDALVASLFSTVEKGRPDLIPSLIYAENEDRRLVLDALADLFDSLDSLASTIQERFPAEVETLRAQPATGLSGALTGAQRAASSGDRSGSLVSNANIRALLADPFAVIRDARGRVSTAVIADDLAAVLIDSKPAFGVGLTLRRANGRWWIDLPLNFPMISRYVPQNREEHEILASMIQVVDNAVLDLRDDIRDGKCANLREASQLAGEKAFAPIALCAVAYDRAIKARAAVN
ncbi:MAG: hypothetical protein AB7G17_04140 [Phycisphaerales bacterium]